VYPDGRKVALEKGRIRVVKENRSDGMMDLVYEVADGSVEVITVCKVEGGQNERSGQ